MDDRPYIDYYVYSIQNENGCIIFFNNDTDLLISFPCLFTNQSDVNHHAKRRGFIEIPPLWTLIDGPGNRGVPRAGQHEGQSIITRPLCNHLSVGR